MSDAVERTEALVAASRRIASSRSEPEVIALATDALLRLTGAETVEFERAIAPGGGPTTEPFVVDGGPDGATLVHRAIIGGGRPMGTFHVRFDDDRAYSSETKSMVDLIAVVTGSALMMAQSAAAERSACAVETGAAGAPMVADRRRMDRDFIDHSRAGQVGFVVFRIGGAAAGSEHLDIDDVLTVTAGVIGLAIRDGDVAYLSGPHEIGVLLPGATKVESAMVAERIRGRVSAHWIERGWRSQEPGPGSAELTLSGGVTAGRYEDPQRLAERALSALEDATEESGDVVITDLGA